MVFWFLIPGWGIWVRKKDIFMRGVHLFPALIITAQTPPASRGEDERQKTVRNALRLGGMFCRYKVCSSDYWPKTFKKKWNSPRLHLHVLEPLLPGSNSSSCANKNRKITSVSWGVHLAEASLGIGRILLVCNLCIVLQGFMQHFILNGCSKQTNPGTAPSWQGVLQYKVSSADWKL